MVDSALFSEFAADRVVRRSLWWNRSLLCLTANGYAIMSKYSINVIGEDRMSLPQLFKAADGSVQEVVESRTLTLDEIDQRLAEAQNHVLDLQALRDQVAAMSAPAAPDNSQGAAADPGAGAATDNSAANGGVDNGQAANTDASAGADQGAAGAAAQGDQSGQAAPGAPGAGQVSDPNAGLPPADPGVAQVPVPPAPGVPDQPIVGA